MTSIQPGVGVLIFRQGKLLLGQRSGSHGAGCWAAPGGHPEAGESIADCARREVKEETGLIITDLFAGPWTEDIFPAEGKHYITLFTLSTNAIGEPQCCEPEKCAGWQWFDPLALPEPLFTPLVNLLAHKGPHILAELAKQKTKSDIVTLNKDSL